MTYRGPERRVKDDPNVPQWEERRGRAAAQPVAPKDTEEIEPPYLWCSGCGAKMAEGEPHHKFTDPGHAGPGHSGYVEEYRLSSGREYKPCACPCHEPRGEDTHALPVSPKEPEPGLRDLRAAALTLFDPMDHGGMSKPNPGHTVEARCAACVSVRAKRTKAIRLALQRLGDLPTVALRADQPPSKGLAPEAREADPELRAADQMAEDNRP